MSGSLYTSSIIAINSDGSILVEFVLTLPNMFEECGSSKRATIYHRSFPVKMFVVYETHKLLREGMKVVWRNPKLDKENRCHIASFVNLVL